MEQREATTASHADATTLATQCLEACPRGQAHTAASIKMWLHEHFGKDVAAVVLVNYKERVLRKGRGEANQRMLLDWQGRAVRLKGVRPELGELQADMASRRGTESKAKGKEKERAKRPHKAPQDQTWSTASQRTCGKETPDRHLERSTKKA